MTMHKTTLAVSAILVVLSTNASALSLTQMARQFDAERKAEAEKAKATELNGDWKGFIACGDSIVAPTRPSFNALMTMKVKGNELETYRKTVDYSEFLFGKVNGDKATLKGDGSWVSGGTWKTELEGQFYEDRLIEGNVTYRFIGKGSIFTSNGTKYRNCTVELSKKGEQQ